MILAGLTLVYANDNMSSLEPVLRYQVKSPVSGAFTLLNHELSQRVHSGSGHRAFFQNWISSSTVADPLPC